MSTLPNASATRLTVYRLGPWTGMIGYDVYPLINVHFHASSTNPKQFVAVPLLWNAWRSSRTTLTGEVIVSPNGETTYAIAVVPDSKAIPIIHLRFQLSDDGLTLRGVCDSVSDDASGIPAIMKRKSTQANLSYYPSPDEFSQNTPRALWRFAIHSILDAIYSHGTNIFWKHIAARRTARHRLMSILYLRSVTESSQELRTEGSMLVMQMQPADVHFAAYAMVEPSKFPWLLPACSVRGPNCQTMLSTTVPCIRCCSPECPPPFEQYASHGYVICEDPMCLEAHMSAKQSLHCIVKTRVEGWTIESFRQTSGKDFHALWEQTGHLQNLLSGDREPSVPSSGSELDREPTRLSTISERDEEADSVRERDRRQRSSTDDAGSLPSDTGKRVRFQLQEDGGKGSDVLVSEPEEMDSVLPEGTFTALCGPLESDSITPDLPADSSQTVISAALYFNNSAADENPRTCLTCKENISLPCWACAECTGKRDIPTL